MSRVSFGVPSVVRQSNGLQRFMLLLGFALVAVFLILAIFAPLIAPYEFNQARGDDGVLFGTQNSPTWDHLFGTTVGGTDVLSRVIWGARTAVIVIILAVILSGLVGVPLGLLSGFIGGWLDRALVFVMDALYAFPSLLLAIVVSIVLSGGSSGAVGGILAAAVSITVVFVPQYYRVIRNATLSVKAEPYVDAARVVGVRTPRILRRHIFSNVSQSLPVIATLNASEAILTLAGLGFLGFGIEPSAAAEWGYDLNKALPDASSGIWWTGVFPGSAIVLIVLGATLVGESLNDILNPLLRTRSGETTTADEAEIEAEFHEITGDAAPSVEIRSDAGTKRVAALSLTDLNVTFRTDAAPVQAVNGVSFDVAPGEVVAVVGESGSGKSVSSRAVLGLLPSTSAVTGSARLRSKDGQEHDLIGMTSRQLQPIRGDQVSMVFQEPSTALNPVYTVGWQIVEGLRAHGTKFTGRGSKKAARARAVELLELVGMPDPAERVDYYPHQLSGGQKQRVVIAMAIASDPDVIIADEPTTALDVTVQAAILELLLSLRDRLGTAIVLITHNMGVVADMADRVVVMYRGSVVEQAPVDQLFAEPAHPYTRALLEAVPHLGRANGPEPVAADSEPVLEINDLVVEFPGGFGQPSFRAVDHVSLTVHRGEVLGLVGESGSGKSTVGRTAVGLQQPTVWNHPRLRHHGLRVVRSSAATPAVPLRFRLPGSRGIAEPTDVDRRLHRRAAARPDRPDRRCRARQGARAARQRGTERRLCRAFPARAVRRTASAGQPGSRPRTRSRSVDRRRADIGTRRVRAGARARPVHRPAAPAQLCLPVHQPRPRRGRRARQPGRRDAERQAGRGGRSGPGPRITAGGVHPTPDRRRSCARPGRAAAPTGRAGPSADRPFLTSGATLDAWIR